jgi:flagellar biosynthesis GTPase FlhF
MMMKIRNCALVVLAFCLVFSMSGGTVFGASARYAVVTEVIGDVTVAKAGGALEIPVYSGMELHEGDKLTVGKGGSLVLKTADRDDEIVIGENWRGTLSKLRTSGKGGSETSIKTWAGSMYNHVRKLAGSETSFHVETPTSVMGARGTHFTVIVDPVTGLIKILVNAGLVDADSKDDGVPVLPSQQLTIYPFLQNWKDLSYIDPEDITVSVSDAVLAKFLKNKGLIDEENEELLNHLQNHDGETSLNLTSKEIFEKYRTNVKNMLPHILKAAAESGKLDSVTLEDIIETVNRSLEETNRKFDLERDPPPLDRTAGIDPAEEEQRRQMREQAEQARQERQNQKAENIRKALEQDEGLLDRLENKRQAQEEERQQAEAEKTQKAIEQYMQQQDEETQKRLEERRQQNQPRDQERPAPSASQPSESPDTSDEPAATSTTIQLSDTSIVYGQPFAITAEVVDRSNAQAVPDGGRVDFIINGNIIGTAAVTSGKAVLTVDEDKWADLDSFGIDAGIFNVWANYAGFAQQYGSSSSPIESLMIHKADTIVELSFNPDPPESGDILEIRVDVAVKAPGGGDPSGMITLYRLENDAWQPVSVPLRLEPGMRSVSFQETLFRDTGASEMRYKAEFVSDNGRHNDGMSEEKLVAVPPPKPVVYVNKSLDSSWGTYYLTVTFDLANFTVGNAVYGAELRFEHNLDSEGFDLFVGEKFQDRGELSISKDTENDRLIIFTFSVFTGESGVQLSDKDNMARIVFMLSAGPAIIDDTVRLVYWKFTDENGNPIAANIETETGVIIQASEQ